MEIGEAIVFWNPWWYEEQWLTAYGREAIPEIRPLFERKEILTISGVRRSGKTTILHLLIKSLLDKGAPPHNIVHFNLEDPAFQSSSIYSLYQQYLILMNPSGKIHLFLDEVQEIPEWEREVRKLYDGVKDLKITVTGSNSSLLKGEYATLLTGRTLFFEVYPFSFKEMLQTRGVVRDFTRHRVLKNMPQILHFFLEYMGNGGFPEVINEKDPKTKIVLLKEYYTSILTRDVLRRYPIRQTRKYEQAAHYLMSNLAHSFSVKNLASVLGINMHTLEEYISFLENVYLLFPVNHFSYSLKQQITFPRKMYCVDNGLVNAVSFKFSNDAGRLLENLVFIEIKRRGREYYYWKGRKECDFIIKDGKSVVEAIQVAHSITQPETRKREMEGLLSAMREFDLRSGKILTYDEFDQIKIDGKVVEVMPAWYWLLGLAEE